MLYKYHWIVLLHTVHFLFRGAVFPDTVYRARQKSNPLGKIRYLRNCCSVFLQINSGYRGGFRLHIMQISLQYLLAFQHYTHLNNVHFSK